MTLGGGFAPDWAKYFQKQGGAPVPDWFRTLDGGMDGGEFAAIVAFMAASDAGGDCSSGSGASGAG